MAFENKNIAHCCALLYIGFSHLTDNHFSSSEKKIVKKKCTDLIQMFDIDLTGDGVIDDKDIKQLFDDVIPYYESLDHKLDKLRSVVTAVVTLKYHKNFEETDKWKEMSEKIIGDLKDLSSADGNIDDEERRWISIIEKTLYNNR